MQIKNLTKEKEIEYFKNIDNYLSKKDKLWTKYIDLNCKIVRLIGYNNEFLPHIEKQLTFCLKENSTKYDATIILWKEDDFQNLCNHISDEFNPKKNLRIRLETLYNKDRIINQIDIYGNNFSKTKPIIDIQIKRGFFIGNNKDKNTYYYGVKNLETEELIKEGHLFIQFLNNILKSNASNLIHGAVIGLNNNGICICARGQRGKSTLCVSSIIKGFDYVSDDYLILNQENKELFANPIYSIITLSPQMYDKLYKNLKNSQFVSNNARKDKYVFNISNFHDKFKTNYPIKLCIFPEITKNSNPNINPCTQKEKNRAIVQLIQSTLSQTQDLAENQTAKKIINMLKNLPFYKFNLSFDINKNTEILFDFMNKFSIESAPIIGLDEICIDITFNSANILNSKTGAIYTMNKFTTNIFENILNGISIENIISELIKLPDIPNNINDNIKLLVEKLKEKGIIDEIKPTFNKPDLNIHLIKEDNYKLSLIEYNNEKYTQLIKEN